MPDQVLFDRAAAGDLNNQAITDEVNRMLQDRGPKPGRTLRWWLTSTSSKMP